MWKGTLEMKFWGLFLDATLEMNLYIYIGRCKGYTSLYIFVEGYIENEIFVDFYHNINHVIKM